MNRQLSNIDDREFDIRNFKYPGHVNYPPKKQVPPRYQNFTNSELVSHFGGVNNPGYDVTLQHWSHKLSNLPCDVNEFYKDYIMEAGISGSMVKPEYFKEINENKSIWYYNVCKPEEYFVTSYRLRLEDNFVFGPPASSSKMARNARGLYGIKLEGFTKDPKMAIFTDLVMFFLAAADNSVIPKEFNYTTCLKYAARVCKDPIKPSDITDCWFGKENQWNSLSGMRKLGEIIRKPCYLTDGSCKNFDRDENNNDQFYLDFVKHPMFKKTGGSEVWLMFLNNLDISGL